MAWLPVLKASLPYITQIISAAIPAFTSKPANGKPDEVLSKQISELQAAVTHNAESVKALATQLKETIEGIDSGSAKLQQEIKMLSRLTSVAIILAVLGTTVAMWALLGKGVA